MLKKVGLILIRQYVTLVKVYVQEPVGPPSNKTVYLDFI